MMQMMATQAPGGMTMRTDGMPAAMAPGGATPAPSPPASPAPGAPAAAPASMTMMVPMMPMPQRPAAAAPAPAAAPMGPPMPPAGQIVPRPAAGFASGARSSLEEGPAGIAARSGQEFAVEESGYNETEHADVAVDGSSDGESASEGRAWAENTPGILNRRKREYDMFDVYHDSNRCERAYRVCITRSKNYIVSRISRKSKKNEQTPKNSDDCTEKPTRIVLGSRENSCYHAGFSDNKETPEIITSPVITLNNPVIPTSGSLDAIIVHDESQESSDYYPQHVPYIVPITTNGRPGIFPVRSPPIVTFREQELSRNRKETAIVNYLKKIKIS